jgi:hypothetical protein
VESRLHLSLKEAVKRHHAGINRCRTESLQGWGGKGSLRVDLEFKKNHRYYLYECETKPNIKRLMEKGRKRAQLRHRTMYSLVVPESEYHRRDWKLLQGYFDIVYAYNEVEGKFTKSQDLRTLGGLQDFVLNIIMPIVRSSWFIDARHWINRNMNHLVGCVFCLLGKRCPLCWSSDDQCIIYKLLWGSIDLHWDFSMLE